MTETIKLECNDGKILEVDYEISKFFVALKDKLNSSEVIRLKGIDSKILKKVIEWTTYHKNDQTEVDVEPSNRRLTVSDWDATFLDVEKDILLGLTLAAYHLDIKRLYEITYKSIGNKIKIMTADQMRSFMNINNDFSSEEMRHMELNENEWSQEFTEY